MQKEFEIDRNILVALQEAQTVELTLKEIRAYLVGDELPENFTSAVDAAHEEFAAGRATGPQYILVRVRHID